MVFCERTGKLKTEGVYQGLFVRLLETFWQIVVMNPKLVLGYVMRTVIMNLKNHPDNHWGLLLWLIKITKKNRNNTSGPVGFYF
jgi:hypothetical protein